MTTGSRTPQGRHQRGVPASGSPASRRPTTSSARRPARIRSPRWCATSRRSSARRRAAGARPRPAACRRGAWRASEAARTRSGSSTPSSTTPRCALYGIEAAGDGVDTDRHAATHRARPPGVLHGSRSYVLQDEDGQTIESHSISAGLDYPGVGPSTRRCKDRGRADYLPATDTEAMDALRLLSRTEGIIPAIESRARPRRGAAASAASWARTRIILVQPSRPRRQGRGDRRRLVRPVRRGARPVVTVAGTLRSAQAIERSREDGRGTLIGYLPVGFPTSRNEHRRGRRPRRERRRRARARPAVQRSGHGRARDPEGDRGGAARRLPRARRLHGRRGGAPRVDAPVLVMTYWNPVLQHGVDRFADDLLNAGERGSSPPTSPPTRPPTGSPRATAPASSRVFLAAPSPRDARLKTDGRRPSRGFVYAVSTMGITGARATDGRRRPRARRHASAHGGAENAPAAGSASRPPNRSPTCSATPTAPSWGRPRHRPRRGRGAGSGEAAALASGVRPGTEGCGQPMAAATSGA